MPAALCADRARRWARRPQRSRSDEKDEATAALAATTPPSLPPSSSMGPPRALAPRARRPATTTPPSLPPSPPKGPPRAPAPPLSCLTPDAGGELTGNPKKDWLPLAPELPGPNTPNSPKGRAPYPRGTRHLAIPHWNLTTASLVWQASPCESADLSQGAMTQRINRRALAHALPRGEGPGDTPRLREGPGSPARACARALGAATVTLRETTGP